MLNQALSEEQPAVALRPEDSPRGGMLSDEQADIAQNVVWIAVIMIIAVPVIAVIAWAIYNKGLFAANAINGAGG